MLIYLQQLSDEIKSKEKDFEELERLSSQLRSKYAKHTTHKTVRDVTEQYQNIDNNVRLRSHILLQFKIRVCEYERKVEDLTQWLNDCYVRIDELPVDISNDELFSQLKDIQVSMHIYVYRLFTKQLSGLKLGQHKLPR